ncbi:hypothetical protein Taro_023593 [Colocasia esculenta]|uniref:Uncharacterized protein n=1 Tax=Colocasia esculenta TaxID=4460 RepID=A0A843V530_COLES|nr:hypothetical protein [Colocasia esculenta]
MANSDRSTASGNYASSGSSGSEEYSQISKLEFSEDEAALIARMYNLIGKRWALIAGRIPGRTAEEIEKYWTSRFSTSE